MGDLTLWGVGTTRTMRPHWAMHELGLNYTTMPISPRSGETQTKEFTALNARQKVPLLQDNDFVMGESAAIVSYLSGAYSTSETSLIPTSSVDYAQWLEWCFFLVTELDSASLYVIRRHSDLKHIYGDAPEVVLQAAAYFTKQLLHVESALADGRNYLLGDFFSSADIILTTCLTWAIFYNICLPRQFHAYLRRIAERPGYKRGYAANFSQPSDPSTAVFRVGHWEDLLALE
ncbi:glutathione S-transferase family protein [Cupriavidus numazuensis]|uniref:Glutathione S-transferase n=1 Tax=Cupriavidus numazuensis TaxID=221992 RepID=A0ABM8TW34_9BURK|nr:glutathione S-transferase family protein [Cupriavidus numazuensis]CAG2160961.1 hypothetical protein LMG26411_07891 [Cupriavidus numazuensis]